MPSRINSYRPKHHGTLKDAATELIEAAGGLREAAELCRVSKTRLGEICTPHREDAHMPVDVVLALEKATGRPAMTEHLAARHGLLVIEIGAAESAVMLNDLQGHVLRQNGATVKAAADAISQQMEASADGVVTDAEAVAMLPALERLLVTAARLRHLLLHMTNDAGGDGID